jgi:ppGpp synthetase/RelA/SpoT-type nucleotidyltranferase
MRNSKRRDELLEDAYRERHEALSNTAIALHIYVTMLLTGHLRIDRISARAKDIKSFLDKAAKKEKGKAKYEDPLNQIQDQIGFRIITFFKSDVERLDAVVKRYFRFMEYKDHVPDSEWEFGYFGRHYILLLPTEVNQDGTAGMVPRFFELQIKTLFQHAWSEAEHDLGYKPGEDPLTRDQKRKLAFTSAQAWGADQMFDDLFRERHSRYLLNPSE